MLKQQRDTREVIAYHEAGHAVMAMVFGFVVKSISIRADEGSEGRVQWGYPSEQCVELVRKSTFVLMAGMAADCIHWERRGDGYQNEYEVVLGTNDDIRKAESNLTLLDEDGAHAVYCVMAMRILQAGNRWDIVELIAETLVITDGIDGAVVLQNMANQCTPVSDEEYNSLVSSINLAIKSGIISPK